MYRNNIQTTIFMPIWYLVIIFCNSDGKEAYSLFYIIKYLYITIYYLLYTTVYYFKI